MYVIVQKLVDAVECIFSKEICSTYERAKRSLSEQNIVECDEAVIKNILRELLEYHVGRLCQKTFIYEFHKYRRSLSLPPDPFSSKAFDLYVSQMNVALLEGWFSQYGCLRNMVTGAVRNSCEYVEDVCSNFSKDIELLCKRQLVESGSKLQSIYLLDSDPHNGSKVALCFSFEPSKKVIYKHRSLEFDTVINHIFCNILKFDALSQKSPVAPTVVRDTYGWQGFIEHEAVKNEELSEAYYNLGLCASVFAALGATDLHDENVIFQGKMPYFIDLETGLKPARREMCSSLHERMEDVLLSSVVGTSILPAKLPTIPHQILIGAINTPYPQKTNEKIFTIKNYGTDAIDIAKEIISVTRPASPIHLAGNQTPDPLPYQSDFLNGYTEGYKSIMDKKEEICLALSDIQCPVRVIVRPTVQYGLLLDACLFPENLVDESSINKILEYLKPTRLVDDPDIADSILKEEIKSIKNGDIPYFYVKANDTRMCTGDYVSNPTFCISPAGNAIHNIEILSERNLIIEKRLIAEGYAEIRTQEANYTAMEELGNPSPFFSQMLKAVKVEDPYPIIDMIQELAITTDGEQAEAGWLGGVYGDCGASYDSINFISLHDTGGTVLLFEQLSKYGKLQKREEYERLFQQAKRGLASLYDGLSISVESDQVSIIAGAGSFDYIFNHNSKRLKQTEQMIEDMKLEDMELGDVYKGTMGIGLLLSTYSSTHTHILDKIYSLFHKDNIAEFSKEGIAHGELGAVWTEFRLSFALHNMERCRELFEQTKQYSFQAAGWCNGNAGLLMILSEMAGALNIESDFYDIANKAMVLPEIGLIDLSVCHGGAGVLQSLLFAYTALGDDRYLSMANNYWKMVLEKANQNGFCTGEKNREYLLGYFLGWSGVAESALLLQICNAGSVPWFPLNLSSNGYQENVIRRGCEICVA